VAEERLDELRLFLELDGKQRRQLRDGGRERLRRPLPPRYTQLQPWSLRLLAVLLGQGPPPGRSDCVQTQ
jgi:hypothetical protein